MAAQPTICEHFLATLNFSPPKSPVSHLLDEASPQLQVLDEEVDTFSFPALSDQSLIGCSKIKTASTRAKIDFIPEPVFSLVQARRSNGDGISHDVSNIGDIPRVSRIVGSAPSNSRVWPDLSPINFPLMKYTGSDDAKVSRKPLNNCSEKVFPVEDCGMIETPEAEKDSTSHEFSTCPEKASSSQSAQNESCSSTTLTECRNRMSSFHCPENETPQSPVHPQTPTRTKSATRSLITEHTKLEHHLQQRSRTCSNSSFDSFFSLSNASGSKRRNLSKRTLFSPGTDDPALTPVNGDHEIDDHSDDEFADFEAFFPAESKTFHSRRFGDSRDIVRVDESAMFCNIRRVKRNGSTRKRQLFCENSEPFVDFLNLDIPDGASLSQFRISDSYLWATKHVIKQLDCRHVCVSTQTES